MKYCCKFKPALGNIGNINLTKEESLRYAKEVNEIIQSCSNLICEIINQEINKSINVELKELFQVHMSTLNNSCKTDTMIKEIFFELENISESKDNNNDCDFNITLKPVRCSIGNTANILL
jgi:hypothetical protein